MARCLPDILAVLWLDWLYCDCIVQEDLEGNSNELFDRFLSRSGPSATHITLTHTVHHTVHHQPPQNDEIELMMEPFPNGQESFVATTPNQRKISQNSSNSCHSNPVKERPDSRSPEQNGDQEWVSFQPGFEIFGSHCLNLPIIIRECVILYSNLHYDWSIQTMRTKDFEPYFQLFLTIAPQSNSSNTFRRPSNIIGMDSGPS